MILMKQIKKLVTVTRRDLSISQQSVQSAHAALDFIFRYPITSYRWHKSNYLIQLTVANESELNALEDELRLNGIKHFVFKEPDLDNQVTAICIEPSKTTRTLTKKFKLL